VRTLNEMVSVEINLRLTEAETAFVSKRHMTPNEMFVEEMKTEVAILQFYSDLIDNGKFDVLNVTMMNKARATTTHINEMMRQPHNFEDVPELPGIARARVTTFLTRVEKLIEDQMTATSTSGTLEADTRNSLAAAEFYLAAMSKRKFNAEKMTKPAKEAIRKIRDVIEKSSHVDKKSDYFKRAKNTADELEEKLKEYAV